VTDHRIGMSVKNLPSVMDGEALQDFIDALRKDYDESLMEDMVEADV
jgi:peptide chain release factor 1